MDFDNTLHIRGREAVERLMTWCSTNLNDHAWSYTPVLLFEPYYVFHFNCPNEKLVALLGNI